MKMKAKSLVECFVLSVVVFAVFSIPYRVQAATFTKPSTTAINRAVAWAKLQASRQTAIYSGYCLTFASQAYGSYGNSLGADSAKYYYLAAKNAGAIKTGLDAPVGSYVYFVGSGSSDYYDNVNHIGIVSASGKYIHGVQTVKEDNLTVNASNGYKGWSWPASGEIGIKYPSGALTPSDSFSIRYIQTHNSLVLCEVGVFTMNGNTIQNHYVSIPISEKFYNFTRDPVNLNWSTLPEGSYRFIIRGKLASGQTVNDIDSRFDWGKPLVWNEAKPMDAYYLTRNTYTELNTQPLDSSPGRIYIEKAETLLHVVESGTNKDGLKWYKVDWNGSHYYVYHEYVYFEANNVWTEQKAINARYRTVIDKATLRELPLAASRVLKELSVGTLLEVVESGKNYFGNLWYKVNYGGVICYIYSERVEYAGEIPFSYTLINESYPSGTIILGKGFPLRGDITSTRLISALTAKVIRVNDGAAVLTKAIYPNSLNATISGAIDTALTFGTLPAGQYRYQVVMDIPNPGMCVDVIRSDFTIASAALPVSVISVTASKLSLSLGDELDWEINAQNGSGAVTYRFQVFKDGTLVDDSGYVSYSKLSYQPRESGMYTVYGYARDSVTENSQISPQVTVSIPTVPVSLIALNPSEATLTVGGVSHPSIDVYPAEATNKMLYWSSSNPGVVVVDQDGWMTGVGPGTTVVTATAQDGSGVSAQCTVTVVRSIETLTITAPDEPMKVGKQYQMIALITPEDATVKSLNWSSSDENIASVDNNGIITTHAIGTTNIVAKAQDASGQMSYTAISVSMLIDSIMFDFAGAVMAVGDTYQIEANISPLNPSNPILTWHCSDERVASVDDAGLVTTLGPGFTVITATANDKGGASAKFEVEVGSKMQTISLPQSTDLPNIGIGTSLRLIPIVLPSDAYIPVILWESSDEHILTVDENGTVTAISQGSAVITAYVLDGRGLNASVELTVVVGLPGDATKDGTVDILDLVSIIDYIVSNTLPTSPANADANGDGTVDILDLVWIIDKIVGG